MKPLQKFRRMCHNNGRCRGCMAKKTGGTAMPGFAVTEWNHRMLTGLIPEGGFCIDGTAGTGQDMLQGSIPENFW